MDWWQARLPRVVDTPVSVFALADEIAGVDLPAELGARLARTNSYSPHASRSTNDSTSKT